MANHQFYKASREEALFFPQQSTLLSGMTGSVGMLQWSFGMNHGNFVEDSPFSKRLQSRPFGLLTEQVLCKIKGEISKDKPFNLETLQSFCENKEQFYCFEEGMYKYIVSLNPTPGMYNVMGHCYAKNYLNDHLEKSQKGIRFMDEDFVEKFRIPDGGKIVEVDKTGSKTIKQCRFIDDTHLELHGLLDYKTVHICQYADGLHREQKEVWPLEPAPIKIHHAEREVEI